MIRFLANRFFIALALALVCAANVRADEAYIWQRVWSAELAAELQLQRDLYTQLRVLALQQSNERAWVDVQVDAKALLAAGLPVTMVVRLPGSKALVNATQLAERITQKLANWQQQGIKPARIEIDFDCAESKLQDYRQMLLGLRQLLPAELRLDITALPAWLNSKQMPALIAAADRVTLQVHAVLAPKRGLFDLRMAEFWVRKLSAISSKEFAVALPAYGAKLILDERDQVVGVEHEMDLASTRRKSTELQATPQSVRALLDAFANRPVKNLGGFVWFRLPLSTDQRAWHPKTLRAVIQKKPLFAKINIRYVANKSGGFDVTLGSIGNLPANAPLRFVVNAQCTGEGLDSYLFNKGVFSTRSALELGPDQQRTVAWLRCPENVSPQVLSR